ncbi:TIGR03773 family transporter-associated surface protein [Streptomyces sp. NPDC058220]|uniref:TIGR03773 family transporter-associated surface protein n=1 Tax=unclassified Streptomyces TaxID=2593676 RepID=UPI00365A8F0B
MAVALAVTLSGGGAAVADDGSGGTRTEFGRIAYTDGGLSLDAGDAAVGADAHVIAIDDDHLADAPAPGWDTTGVARGAVSGDTVRWSLTGLDGPGELKVYGESDDDAEDTLLFDSADGLPDAYEVPVGEEGATRWEFAAEGTYQAIFSAEATSLDGRALSVGAVYTVLVGNESIAEAATNGKAPAPEKPVVEEALPAEAPPRALTATPLESARRATSVTAAPTPTAADVVSTTKVLDEGHIDFAARVVGGKLQIHVKDGTVSGKTTWREPSSVVLHVKSEARKTLPDSEDFSFLGKGGDPVWLLDQVQQQGLLWPGWSTDNITAGATKGGVKFSLTGVEGPGAYALYTYDAMSGADVLFNSKDGVPDSFDVAANTHAHGGWAFTKDGTYRLTFKMSGQLADGTAVSDTETVAFVVGDGSPSGVKPGAGSGSETSPGTGDTSPDTSSAAGSGSGDGTSDDGGSMASTGAGNTALLGGAAAALAALGAGFVVATRRRRTAGRNSA